MPELVNRKNHTLVKEFLEYEKRTKNHSTSTTERYYSYFKHLLNWAGSTYFANVYIKEPTFVQYLQTQISPKTNKPLSLETWKKVLGLTTRFFKWAKMKKKDFKHYPDDWIEYLTIPKHVGESDDREIVTLDEILKIANLEFGDNLALRRDQAAAIMLFLSGMRASAFVTLPIKAVDIENRTIKQYTSLGVITKNGKSQKTFQYDIKPLLSVLKDWDDYIRDRLPPESPWYTPIENTWGIHELSLKPPGKNRNHALNKRLKVLFAKANLPYRSAHKFRRGHLVYGLNNAKTIDVYKALSENMMHINITTTDQYYAKFSDKDRQQKIDSIFT